MTPYFKITLLPNFSAITLAEVIQVDIFFNVLFFHELGFVCGGFKIKYPPKITRPSQFVPFSLWSLSNFCVTNHVVHLFIIYFDRFLFSNDCVVLRNLLIF